MDICRANKWEFVLTFKEGVMPKVWDEVCQAQRRGRKRKLTQAAWARVISTALHVIGFAAIPKQKVGAMRMRRFHLPAA